MIRNSIKHAPERLEHTTSAKKGYPRPKRAFGPETESNNPIPSLQGEEERNRKRRRKKGKEKRRRKKTEKGKKEKKERRKKEGERRETHWEQPPFKRPGQPRSGAYRKKTRVGG